MKNTLLSLLLTAVLLIPTHSRATHLLGGEISWECVPVGADAGKFIFTLKLYRACYMGAALLPTSASISNPLYASYGGPAAINCPLVSTSDLAPPCFSSSFQLQCGLNQTAGGGSAVEEHLYVSSAVQLNGIPATTGSEFWFSTCCRPPATLLRNVSGSGYFLRSIMYPYIDPVSGSPRSVGTVQGGATCYDSSPIFAARPQIAVCGRQNVSYQHLAFDVNGDSLDYSWSPQRQSASNPITWRTGYSDTLQLPNKNHDTLNVDPVLNTQTGVISFNTNSPLSGYHSIGVKASSYKNGQKVADIFRDIVVSIVDCDTISSVPPLTNLTAPTIGIKDTISTVYQPNYTGYFPVGSEIALDIQTLDIGLLPTSPISSQSVDLEMYGVSMSGTPNDSTDCIVEPCAYLDSNNVAWQNGQFKATAAINARFYWNTSCQNLEAFNVFGGGSANQQFVFMVRSRDDWCPIPAESFTTIELFLVDTSASTWPMDSLDASQGGASVHWPAYSGSGFVSYEIYRSYDPLQPWSLVGSITNQSTTSFFDATARTDSAAAYYLIEINNGPGCFIGYEIRSIFLDAAVSTQFTSLQWNRPYTNVFQYTNGKYYIYRRDTLTTWDLIDSTSFGVETYIDSIYIYNEEVEYRIESTDQYGLYSISNVDSIRVDSTFILPGIDVNELDEVRIFPNPASSLLFLEFEAEHSYENAMILDYSGKLITEFSLSGSKLETMNVQNLNPGMYMMWLITEKGEKFYRRFLISR